MRAHPRLHQGAFSSSDASVTAYRIGCNAEQARYVPKVTLRASSAYDNIPFSGESLTLLSLMYKPLDLYYLSFGARFHSK